MIRQWTTGGSSKRAERGNANCMRIFHAFFKVYAMLNFKLKINCFMLKLSLSTSFKVVPLLIN